MKPSERIGKLHDAVDQTVDREILWIAEELHGIGQEVAHLEERVQELEQRPSIKVSDEDVWLIFPSVMISIEGICKSGMPGPIVRRNLRRWRDDVLAKPSEVSDD